MIQRVRRISASSLAAENVSAEAISTTEINDKKTGPVICNAMTRVTQANISKAGLGIFLHPKQNGSQTLPSCRILDCQTNQADSFSSIAFAMARCWSSPSSITSFHIS